MKITIFTAIYNRAHLLERVWRSLVEQNFSEMEWIVVDDGSTDKTCEIEEELKAKSEFDVVYIRQERGGKHRAINRGIELARGELFFIVDSDDWLTEGALEKVWDEWMKVENKAEYAGVCGFDVTPDGKIIGGGISMDRVDSDMIAIRNEYGVEGDMKEVFRTSVLREYPFPEIENEMFCPEQLVWYRISQKYKMRFFNEGIYVAEYQKGGLTERIVKIRRESPIASMMTYSEATRCDIGFGLKVRSAINYWRFFQYGKGVKIDYRWWWLAPLGWMIKMLTPLMYRVR